MWEFNKHFTKENFAEWYEDVIGEPIEVEITDDLWKRIKDDIESAISSAVEETVSNISNEIYEEEY
jgi:hypothetical protein